MKTLQNFIIERSNINIEQSNINIKRSNINEEETSVSIVFDFTDLENAEETLKSLEEREGCSVEENKLTVTITSDNCDKLDTVQDILQQYAETLRNSPRRSSDEQYAQKTKAFAEKVDEFNDALDKVLNTEEE